MKIKVYYDGGQNEDIDWYVKCMLEYFMVDANFVGSGYNHETGWRDIEYNIKLPKKKTLEKKFTSTNRQG